MEEIRNFKTNAKCGGCVAAIGAELNRIMPAENWHIDLTSPDKTLSVKSELSDEAILEAVSRAGFVAQKL